MNAKLNQTVGGIAPFVNFAGLFQATARRLLGLITRLVRPAFNFQVPVGYEDENGFQFGTAPAPQASKSSRSAFVFVVVGGMLATATFQASAGQKLNLAWQPSTSPTVAGYNIYYGSQAGSYTNKISVGNVTSATVCGLNEGVCTHFIVTARDTLGFESLPSNELSYTMPNLFGLAIQLLQGNPASLTVTSTGSTPAAWVLESSSNLQTWATAAEGSNSQVSVSMVVTGTPSLFFRLRSQ